MGCILITVTVKAPNHKMQLTTGIQPVNLNLRHLEVGSDPEVGTRPAHRS